MLYHCVYFWLKPELTAEQRAEFRRGVVSLKGIKSVGKVSVGVPAGTTRRPVIDSSYDVALIVECKDVAAEAAYQVDPLHLAFVERFKTFWTKVQIYDSE
ncbi:MAG TPA: Dabb family protein [Lacunisphaera sp.]|nr:Dabb family protein [Lacunisphaera sp.]